MAKSKTKRLEENPRFQKLLKWHKGMIGRLKTEPLVFGKFKELGQELALFASDFKCVFPGCTSTDELTYHHFIERSNKDYLVLHRWRAARYYWNNVVVLCLKHHCMHHGFNYKKAKDKMGTLDSKKLAQIEQKFLLSEQQQRVVVEPKKKDKSDVVVHEQVLPQKPKLDQCSFWLHLGNHSFRCLEKSGHGGLHKHSFSWNASEQEGDESPPWLGFDKYKKK